MSEIKEELKSIINWCFGLTTGIAIAFLAKDKIYQLYQNDILLGVGSLILLVGTVVRFFIYLTSVKKELNFLDNSFEIDSNFSTKGSVYGTAFLISITFGLLITYVTNIYIYCSLSILLSLADLYGQSTVKRNVAILLFEVDKLSDRHKAIFKFYLEKPLLLHAALYLVISSFALLISFYGNMQSISLLSYISYSLMILVIFIGEYIIYKWRKNLIYEYY